LAALNALTVPSGSRSFEIIQEVKAAPWFESLAVQ
jgi:hypothetical protein